MHVVVIGAGVIGAAVSDQLSVRGARVTALDLRGPGRGASQASAGILAPFTEAHQGSPLLPLGTRSLAMFDDFVSGVAQRSGRPVEFSRSGTLEVAFDEAQCAKLQASHAWLQERGVASEWIDGALLTECEPGVAPEACGGLLVTEHGFVSVPALVDALVHSARFGGATFESPTEVVSVEAGRDGVEVRAGERRWSADAVVVAAGSWSGRISITGAPRTEVRPVRGQLLHLGWPGLNVPSRVVWGPECYTVPWSDGTLLVGATVEDVGFDESTTVAGVGALMSAVETLLPAAAKASIRELRVGLRPIMPDGLPAIGPLPVSSRVVVATGHYRNGILLCPLTADLVTRFILDGDVDPVLAVTDPARSFDDGARSSVS